MISLRSFTSSFTAVAALALIGCGHDLDSPTGPTGLSPNAANYDGRPGDVGNSAKNGSIATRVLLDAQGNASLEVRTGTFDNASNTPATPPATAGYFQKIQYKVLDARGHEILVKNVEFKTDGVNVYRTAIDLCSKSDDDDDFDHGNSVGAGAMGSSHDNHGGDNHGGDNHGGDNHGGDNHGGDNHGGDNHGGDNHGGSGDATCTTTWGAGWTVLVQANLKGVAPDGKKTDVVRDQQPGVYLPDVDIKTQQVWLGVGGNRSATLSVVSGAAATFSVDFPNTKSINGQAPAMGANMMCAVFVDGAQQTVGNANGFAYSGAQNIAIAPGQTVPCIFSLTLGFGAHTIHVSAMPLYPGDYDQTNNTTADFNIVSASPTGNPDVAAGLTQADTGTGIPHNLNLLSIRAQLPITFWQYASLLSGQAPSGALTCTLTILNTTTNTSQTVSGTVTVSPGVPSGACKIPYTFAAAGTYTITPVVAPPSGDTDANPANNTGAPVTITVAPPLPEATVTVNDITFTDPGEHISNQSFVPGGSPADTVHSGDVATYAATIGVSSLLNTSDVNTISCKVSVDGVDKTNSATWVSGPTLTNVAAGTATCSITQAFIETDNNLHPHTITFSVTTGIKNNALAGSTTATGTINDIRRVDVLANGLQVLVNGVPQPLSTTPVVQGATATLQAPLTNLNPNVPTVVSCGPLLSEVDPVVGYTVPATDTAASAFSPVTNTPTVSLAAGGTGFCSYTITGPQNLGVGAIPLVAVITPTSSSPADPVPANNPAVDVLTLKSNGAFTDIHAAQVVVTQEWSTAAGQGLSVPTPFDSLHGQAVEVDQLALLVIPNNADLGSFTFSGAVSSNGANYGTGSYTSEVFESDAGLTCQRSATTGLVPAGAINPNQRYHIAICSAPAPNQPGFQIITVDYTQDLGAPILDASYPLFTNTIDLKVILSYHLAKGNITDQVSALVSVPVPSMRHNGSAKIEWSTDAKYTTAPPIVIQSPAP